MRLRYGQKKPIEAQTLQVNEIRIETNKGEDLHERENEQHKPIEGKVVQVNEPRIENNEGDDLEERENQILSWVGAYDCIKEKILRNYSIQMMGINAVETKPNQPKISHYKYMKQKVKLAKTKATKEKYQDCQVEWDKHKENEENFHKSY